MKPSSSAKRLSNFEELAAFAKARYPETREVVSRLSEDELREGGWYLEETTVVRFSDDMQSFRTEKGVEVLRRRFAALPPRARACGVERRLPRRREPRARRRRTRAGPDDPSRPRLASRPGGGR